jgi:hypothetical protein
MHHFQKQKGFSTVGFLLTVLVPVTGWVVYTHYMRPSFQADRYVTSVNSLLVNAFTKPDEMLRNEITAAAGPIGIIVRPEAVALNRAPGGEYLDIDIAYAYPVNLLVRSYHRDFRYTHRRDFTFEKKIIDSTQGRLRDNSESVVDRARDVTKRLNP